MKRVKAACVLQTLIFAQKDDCGLTREQQYKVNCEEVERYKAAMDRARTRPGRRQRVFQGLNLALCENFKSGMLRGRAVFLSCRRICGRSARNP